MSAINGLSEAQLAELTKFDTPTVCNVIELWDFRPRNTGYMNDTIKACFPKMPPMVGYAVTSTFRSMAPPQSGDVYAGMVEQVESFAKMPGPPLIVYQDLDEPTASATFGEVMCTTYKSFGARGLITSGTGRDLDQVEAIDFPCFTNGSMCAHGYCHTLAVNVPVTVGGLCVNPGDLLHGDLNGVTTIPHELASEIAGACKELMTAEDIVLDYVKSGDISPQGFAAAREECGNVIAALGKRLRGET
ncbi:MAG: RraA family protein [Planctomycetes bacterium]|nr:RraA family protein [Planctomycetota bacterium]